MPKWLEIVGGMFGGEDRLHAALEERDYLNAQIEARDAGKPMVNIDGTPMMGDVDINGNPYGVTQVGSFGSSGGFDDNFGSGTGGFSDDSFGSGMNNDF